MQRTDLNAVVLKFIKQLKQLLLACSAEAEKETQHFIDYVTKTPAQDRNVYVGLNDTADEHTQDENFLTKTPSVGSCNILQ